MTMVTIEPYGARLQIDNCTFIADYIVGTIIMEEFNELLTAVKLLDYSVDKAKIENSDISVVITSKNNSFSVIFKLQDQLMLRQIDVYGVIGETVIDLIYSELDKKPNIFKILKMLITEF